MDQNTLPEGAKVTILVHEDDGTFEVSAEEETRLLAAIAEAQKGDSLDASLVLQELRQL